jgi:hypothetical protein
VDGHALGDGARLYPRITDALARARAFRATSDAPVDIAVRPGTYVGTFGANADGALEDLPLVLNVPNLRIHGNTRLRLDAAGRPVGPLDASGQTVIQSDGLAPDSCLVLNLVTVERASIGDGPVTGGDGTTIERLTLRTVGYEMAVMVNRAQDVTIRQVWADAGGSDALEYQFASGRVEETLVTGSDHAMQAGAGNDAFPAHVVFDHVRSIENDTSGLNVYALYSVDWLEQYVGGQQRDTLTIDTLCTEPPGLAFFCPDALSTHCSMPFGDLLTLEVRDCELDGGGVGLRFWLSGILDEPSSIRHGRIDATVTNNVLTGHRNFALDLHAGFSALDQDVLGADVNLVVAGNQLHGNRAPALLAFQGLQELLGDPFIPMQPFQDSTYTVLDLDGELVDADWDVPHCDPDLVGPPFVFSDPDTFTYGDNCPGQPGLGDQLSINGVVVPYGARLSPRH